ncbi:cell surface glycoprotein CD200 receptor 4-like isoform X1 [Arapaima gigas]
MVSIWTAKTFYLLSFCFLWRPMNVSPTGDCLHRSQAANFSLQPLNEQFFQLDRTANIVCHNSTVKQIIYNIWNLQTAADNCCIAWHVNESQINTCRGGKKLKNGTKGESYLYIPQFTRNDEGLYTCETSYWGGGHAAKIQVSAIVPPEISIKLELHHDRRVAVCLAAGGKPAASISWSGMVNLTEKPNSTRSSDGTFTVESRLVLPKNASDDNFKCIVTHPSWVEAYVKEIPLPRGDGVPWKWIGICLASMGLIVLLLASICLTWKHLSSILVQHCCKVNKPPKEEALQKQDVEELELQSGYVQRVNSIYNSSADLCNH